MLRREFLWTCWIFLIALGPGYAQSPVRLRVLSYNIHHGEGTDGKIDLSRIARVIQSAKPDLVALQEVDRGTQRSGEVDQAAELGRLTGLDHVFKKNIPLQGGEYGNAVLSRWPIKRQAHHNLPLLTNGEQRGVLEVEVEPAQGILLLFLATHFDHRPDDRERLASVKAIEELVRARPTTAICLAGDLNAAPETTVLKAFQSNWQVARGRFRTPTFPASIPFLQLDHILVRPSPRWKIIGVRVLNEPVASDHRPLLAELELKPK